ncbi:acyl carrier protein phosphodiesterase [Algoriphagus boritolerans]|uniref:Acyl carrier protein phosphodiesterase n=1 Tax=Algoriphagus boritolerans DSM 17298 = JCM 18970 TaxID=1120964 RepID=A0A1H5ZVI3_9BACT|nr:ACP phosphodiesterase [Algoriphagus boritolerans]SEG40162.1 Acyl carrier protein phosphodiesterase [Algoriphagus boritolerans DSM 17298 = JCM 18970]
MNFLAHAYLSFDREGILIGNFVADFIKGKELNRYHDEIFTGILLHREIDAFTDSHPLVRAGQSYLRPRFRHYSTVITDIFFDYFLGKNWEKFSNIPLEDFVNQTYNTLESHSDLLPESFKEMFYWMKSQNWLYHYREIEGIQKALTGLTRRTTFDSKMNEAPEVLLEKEAEFELIFFAFFKELETFARAKLIQLQQIHGSH